VGNDFLPHLPHLHINKGALTELYDVYKKELPSLGGKETVQRPIDLGPML
jgi:5'-3' exoribonuclease 1